MLFRLGSLYFLTHLCVTGVAGVRPVVIIPGATESRLYARVDHSIFDNSKCLNDNIPDNEWFMVYLQQNITFNCTASILAIHYDEELDQHYNSPGVEVDVEVTGGLESIISPTEDVSQMEYAAHVLDMLKTKGHISYLNIHGLNYDWRAAINELNMTYDEWKQLIEETYSRNGNERVVIVGHSMGGLIGTYFLRIMKPEWKAKYIHKYVPVSADFLGSILGLTVFPGFPFPYKAGQYGHGIGVSLYMNLITQQIVSLTPGYINNLPNIIARKDKDTVMMQLPDRNLTIGNYDDLFHLLDLPPGLLQYYKKHRDLTNNNEHPGVNVSCLYSLGLPTPNKFAYESWKDFPASPVIGIGTGDLMVEEESLAACKEWADDERFSFKLKILDATIADHVTTFKADFALQAIYDLIAED